MKPLRLWSLIFSGIFFPIVVSQAIPMLLYGNAPENCTLPAPSSLNAVALSDNSAAFNWSSVANATAYHVRVYTQAETTLVADYLVYELNTTVNGLQPGTGYRCYVSAVCSVDNQGSEAENSIVIDIILNNSSPGNEAVAALERPEHTAQFVPLQNPFDDVMQFKVEAALSPLPYQAQVVRADGAVVLQQQGMASAGETIQLATNGFAKGLYFVRIETAGAVQVFSMVKQ